MNYNFSNSIADLQPSAIREILKFTSMPGVISFAGGNPAPEAFPSKEIAELSAAILEKEPVMALQYSVSEGYPPLIKRLYDFMRLSRDTGSDDDSLIITSGAQQVMDLTTKALCNPGDAVICENPSFIGSLNCFRSYGMKLCGIPVEPDGMNIEALENTLKTEKKAKFIYTIPNFQNPSGVTMSLEKRKAVYELAKKYGVIILEDNPYGEIRFSGENVPNIKSMDTDGIVIYAGTLSKVLSPGMRVGYALANKTLIAKLTVCKQVSDVHTNIWAQITADEFFKNYNFDEHLKKLRAIYRKKSSLMLNAIDEKFDKRVTYNPINGGFFIWCTLPDEIDMQNFCKIAVQNKVAVVPGNAFIMNESDPCQSFRLNFTTPTDDQITKGIAVLGDLIKSMLA